MHFEMYVDSFIDFSGLYVFTPLINPIEPIDIRSSCSTLDDAYFLQTCATSLRLCSIKIFLAFSSPIFH